MAEPKDDTGPIIDPPTNHNEPTYPEMLAYSMADDLNALGALAGEMTEAVNALRPEKGKPPQIKSDEDVLTLAPLAKRARASWSAMKISPNSAIASPSVGFLVSVITTFYIHDHGSKTGSVA